MAENDRIFEDAENLQAAIGKALQENKALLCFVSDESDETTQWKSTLLAPKIRERLQSSTVILQLKAGSEQAGFLSSVCPVQHTPAIIIIHNAQVVANYQHGQTTIEKVQEQLTARYAPTNDSEQFVSQNSTNLRVYLDLPASEGRMRLPENAYDQLRKLTQQYMATGVKGKALLQVQLRLLDSLKIDVISAEVSDIRQRLETITEPTLSDEVTQRLLNTPASKLQATSTPANQTSAAVGSSSSASTLGETGSPSTSAPNQRATSSMPTSASHRSPGTGRSAANTDLPPSEPQISTSQVSQRAQYIAAQKTRESAQSAERARIKAQIEADKAARRESEAAASAEQRRIDLQNLRKANSTTSDPKASDVRIQVRLFDGSTIRNSFPAEATVAKEVREWIDGEVTKKAVAGVASAGQPYSLKLILTPLPNRTIEAGEEDQAISDLEGVRGSATMVMVPVRGYVDSYSGVSGGIVGGVIGGASSVVGAGIGLVGSAAGMVVGGLGRLLGAGGTQQPQSPSQTQQRDSREGAQEAGSANGARSNVRVRTLADQRSDEEDERRRKGTDLYNGMGLNVQPRKDDDKRD